jgi:hypothetical protein
MVFHTPSNTGKRESFSTRFSLRSSLCATRSSYDGALLKGTTWAGTVAGSVTRKYNNDFNVTERAVNGLPVTFGYDQDNLLIQAGSLSLSRHAQNGLLTGRPWVISPIA